VLDLRLDPREPSALKPLADQSGYLGDRSVKTIRPAASAGPPGAPTVWLPTERIARAWLAMATGRPFGQ